MYKVIKTFKDLQDNGYIYTKGDEYPREGMTASKERIKELAGKNNIIGEPIIKEVKKKVKKDESE